MASQKDRKSSKRERKKRREALLIKATEKHLCFCVLCSCVHSCMTVCKSAPVSV